MRILFLSLLGLLCFRAASAQELEPRAFSPTPTGLNFLLLGYSRSEGNVFFDQALLITGATGTVHGASGAYVRTFGVAGMSAKLSVLVPFAWGDWQGLVDGVPASTSRRGFADARGQLAVNFIGAPAAAPRDFVAYRERTIVGGSLAIVAPTGQYDGTKLINLGSNRWAFRPRLGVSHTTGRWTLEAMADVWVYSRIPEAFGGTVISQAPIGAIQANVIHTFKKGLWLGIGGGVASGGRTTVNGVKKDNAQQNSRFAATLTVPLARQHSLKLSYANSVSARTGSDFDLLALGYVYRWGRSR